MGVPEEPAARVRLARFVSGDRPMPRKPSQASRACGKGKATLGEWRAAQIQLTVLMTDQRAPQLAPEPPLYPVGTLLGVPMK
jgi:hypothetical protein